MVRIFSPSRSITTVVVGSCIVLVVWIAFFVLPSKVFAVAPSTWCCATYGQPDALSTIDKTGLVSGSHPTGTACGNGGGVLPGEDQGTACTPVVDYFDCTQGTCGGGGSTGTSPPTENPTPTCGKCQKKTNQYGNSCQGAGWGTPDCDVCTLSAPTCRSGCKVKKNCAGSCSGSGVGTPQCSGTTTPPVPVCKNFTIQGPCSASCGGGTKTVTRFNTCGGGVSSDVPCNTQPCSGVNVDFSASPPTINQGDSSNLIWAVSGGATSCTASGGWSGSKSVSGGSQSVTPPSTTGYDLACSGPSGSGSDSATVFVVPPIAPPNEPPAVDLSSSGGKKDNGCYDIDWNANGVDAEFCSPSSSPISSQWQTATFPTPGGSGSGDNIEVCPETATTLTLTCGSYNGSLSLIEPFLREINPGQTPFNLFNFLRDLFPGFVKSSYASN